MKIGFVLDDSMDRPDGVQQYVGSLGRWLSDQGHDVSYICVRGEVDSVGMRLHELADGANVAFNGNRLRLAKFASRNDIRRVLENEDYDVLHVQLPASPTLGLRVAKVAKSLPKAPSVVGTFHILPFRVSAKMMTRLYGLYHRRYNRYIDSCVSVSEPARVYAQRVFGLSGAVLPNVVDHIVLEGNRSQSKRQSVVFLGRLVSRKGCKQFLHALALLQCDVDVEILGDGPDRAMLQRLADKLQLSNVTFHGSVSEQSKYEWLAGCDIAAFPSLGGESFGIVLLEAMAAGAGVVLAGNNDGYRSVMTISDALVDPHDAKAFARKIDNFLQNTELFQDVHEQQQELVKQFYTQSVGPKLLKLYQGTL